MNRATEQKLNGMVHQLRYGMVQLKMNKATDQKHNGMDQQQSMDRMEWCSNLNMEWCS